MKTYAIALLLALPTVVLAQEAKAPEAATATDTAGDATTAGAPTGAPAGDILLAPKVGFFKSTTPLEGALYLGAEVGYVTPFLDRKLAIVLEGAWHQPRYASSVTDPRLTVDGASADGAFTLVERELSILLTLVYRAEGLLGPVTPYGGVGPGLYLHHATITAFGSTWRESEGTLGFQLLAGAEYGLGPGAAFFEAHYHFTNIDFLSTGKVNVGGFLAASLGYRFRF